MKIRKIDRRIERHILIGMITDTNYLSFVSTKMTKFDLENQYARTVAGWCLEYFEKYGEAPKKEISKIYEYHDRREEINDQEVDLIQKLLEDISSEYSEIDSVTNVDFLLDKTEEYLKRNAMQRLMIDVENKIEEGDVKGAESEIIKMKPVQITAADGIDPLADLDRIKLAFSNNQKPLMEFEGSFGVMINEHLTRDSFVCFQAPEKTGKTWLLYLCAIIALKHGLRVSLFQAGDMTESQSIVRLGILLCNKSNKKKYCGEFCKPRRFFELPGGREKKHTAAPGNYDIEFEDVNISKPLTAEEAHETYEKFKKEYNLDKNFRLFTHPADTLSFTDIDSELDRLEKTEGFVTDVLIVDYMDLMRCEEKTDTERGSVNKIWKRAKSLNNKRHLLLISATQANALSYDGSVQGRGNFSEDKRKYAHVNIMIGMSQSASDKKDNVMKFNSLVARDSDFSSSSVCFVLQSLRTGEPIIDSVFHEVENEGDSKTHSKRSYANNNNKESYSKTKNVSVNRTRKDMKNESNVCRSTKR